ncbi:MAG: hypothetical protein QOD53_1868, partial [Thermoleophilaceae bacterium]|nr:hypothetical protein [Thermoleophilaceae bacterium]
MVRSRRWLLGASLLACLALAAPASATTRTVSTTADSGGGSLRATVAASGNGDKVVVPAGTYTLTSAQIPIAKSIEVEGAGSGSTTIAGNGADRIFDLQNTGAVKISKLALDIRSTAHGGVIYGGGIRTDAASPLTLAGVRISGVANVSGGNNQSGGVLYGAAIYALGNLTLTGTTIDGVRGLSTGGSGTGGGGGVIYGTVYAGKDLSIAGSSIGSGVLDAHATGNTHNGGVIYG